MSYTGIKTIVCNKDEDYLQIYEYPETLNLLTNQYLIVKNDKDEVVDKRRWNGESLESLKYKTIDNRYFDKFKPRFGNVEQECFFDLMQNPSIIGKMVCGKAGSGKSVIAMAHMIDWVFGNKAKYDKIVFIRNMQLVKDIGNHAMGSLPGTVVDKQILFAMQFADVLGSVTELESMIASEKLVLEPLGMCRGRSYTNSVIYVSEAENLNSYLMGLIMSRVGEGSILVVDGDIKQIDSDKYVKDNGMKAMIEKVSGHPLFGMVTLQKNERSEFSSLSDLLLE